MLWGSLPHIRPCNWSVIPSRNQPLGRPTTVLRTTSFHEQGERKRNPGGPVMVFALVTDRMIIAPDAMRDEIKEQG